MSNIFEYYQPFLRATEQAAIEGTPALMKAPLMDPSKNPQITRGEPTPPPEE